MIARFGDLNWLKSDDLKQSHVIVLQWWQNLQNFHDNKQPAEAHVHSFITTESDWKDISALSKDLYEKMVASELFS